MPAPMIFADPRAAATAYLILRHLYDGDVIDWPIADDDPHRETFAALEAQGFVARWDRVWPLHDRYRLTDKGIAAIEAVYRPAGAEAFFDQLRQRNLGAAERRAHLQAHGLNPALWPLLHDPSTHWSTFTTLGGPYHAYVWEDLQPPKRRRQSTSTGTPGKVVPLSPSTATDHNRAFLYDLDREVDDRGPAAPSTADYDVS